MGKPRLFLTLGNPKDHHRLSALISPHAHHKPVYSTQHIKDLFTGATLLLNSNSAYVKQVFYSHFSISVEYTSNWLGSSQFLKDRKIY
jgi:hypothetical protein